MKENSPTVLSFPSIGELCAAGRLVAVCPPSCEMLPDGGAFEVTFHYTMLPDADEPTIIERADPCST